jgi:hypothetical protein
MKIIVKRLIKGEKGQAMVLVLVLLIVGGLIVSPLLSYMGTGLLTGRVYEGRTAELYAADAGFEDGVWKVQHRDEAGAGYVPCSPSSPPRTYNITANNRSVGVNIVCVSNVTGYLWDITSIATTDSNSRTTVESYVQFISGGELNIFGGALASQGSISLGKDSTVTGDIYHCGGFDNSTVSGNWTDKGCAPFPSQAENIAFAQAFMDEAKKGGTYNGNMGISKSGDLGPKYITGNLDISKDVTINLKGIVYVKGHISCAKTLTITGSGSLVAEGYIYLSKLANYTVTGDSIIMSLNSDITIKKSDPAGELSIGALIYAPNGAITFDKDMTIFGGVVGKSIQADKEGSFTFVPKTSWDFPGQLPGSLDIKTYNVSQ